MLRLLSCQLFYAYFRPGEKTLEHKKTNNNKERAGLV